jgi:hypothetical protein
MAYFYRMGQKEVTLRAPYSSPNHDLRVARPHASQLDGNRSHGTRGSATAGGRSALRPHRETIGGRSHSLGGVPGLADKNLRNFQRLPIEGLKNATLVGNRQALALREKSEERRITT